MTDWERGTGPASARALVEIEQKRAQEEQQQRRAHIAVLNTAASTIHTAEKTSQIAEQIKLLNEKQELEALERKQYQQQSEKDSRLMIQLTKFTLLVAALTLIVATIALVK